MKQLVVFAFPLHVLSRATHVTLLLGQMRDINADTTTAAIAGSADAAAAAAASAAAASIPSLKHSGDLGGDAGKTSPRYSYCMRGPASGFAQGTRIRVVLAGMVFSSRMLYPRGPNSRSEDELPLNPFESASISRTCVQEFPAFASRRLPTSVFIPMRQSLKLWRCERNR